MRCAVDDFTGKDARCCGVGFGVHYLGTDISCQSFTGAIFCLESAKGGIPYFDNIPEHGTVQVELVFVVVVYIGEGQLSR